MKYPVVYCVVFAVLLLANLGYADTRNFDQQMEPVLEEYLKIPKILAADQVDGVVEVAKGNMMVL